MSGLTAEDLEQIQQPLPNYRMKLVDGTIILVSSLGYESVRDASFEYLGTCI